MEVEKFKQALRKMFASRGPSVLVYCIHTIDGRDERSTERTYIRTHAHAHMHIYTAHPQSRAGKGVLFLETVQSIGNRRQHTAVECIPVPRSAALDAPLYFKQVGFAGNGVVGVSGFASTAPSCVLMKQPRARLPPTLCEGPDGGGRAVGHAQEAHRDQGPYVYIRNQPTT